VNHIGAIWDNNGNKEVSLVDTIAVVKILFGPNIVWNSCKISGLYEAFLLSTDLMKNRCFRFEKDLLEDRVLKSDASLLYAVNAIIMLPLEQYLLPEVN